MRSDQIGLVLQNDECKKLWTAKIELKIKKKNLSSIQGPTSIHLWKKFCSSQSFKLPVDENMKDAT